MAEPHSSNFRVITKNVLGVRIFRKFTVAMPHEKTNVHDFSFKRLSISANNLDLVILDVHFPK